MSLRKKRLRKFKLYGVTDFKKFDNTYLRRIEKALKGGVDVIQLRSKELNDRELVLVGYKLKALAKKYSALFFVNDRLDICRLLDADGLHLGQDDIPVSDARRLLPLGRLIGKSTHSLQQARAALNEDVDYIGCGPIFGTPTKPAYQPVGLSLIEKVQEISHVPVVCIGGIDLGNVQDVIQAGADRVAVVRALFDSKDPEKAAIEFKKALNLNVGVPT